MRSKMLKLTAALLLIAMLIPMAASASYTMYVKTGNGKTANLRDTPSTNANIITRLPYGTAVTVLQNEGVWSAIEWPGRSNPAWIMSKFLIGYYPGTAPDGKNADGSTGTGSILDVNFKSFKLVDPHYAYVQAAHAGGFVNLRWAPSKDAAVQTRLHDGDEVMVIAKGSGWIQVQDDSTGYVGFVQSNFLVRAD